MSGGISRVGNVVAVGVRAQRAGIQVRVPREKTV